MPKISVVIPLFNKERHIVRAINSVLAQTVQDFEIVVVNDGSKDGGGDIVRVMTDSRIRLIHQENGGVSSARNKGIKESYTELIAFLDADDEWKPIFLETVLNLKERFPGAGAYVTAYEIKGHYGKIYSPNYKAIPLAPWEGVIPNYFESILGDLPVWSSAIMIPKKVFNVCGVFPLGERLGEDLDMWLRVALRYPIAFSRKIGAIHFQNAQERATNREVPLKTLPFQKTAQVACASKMLSKKDLFFLKEYINKFEILAAIQCIRFGYIELGKKRLEECDTEIFRGTKLTWLRLLRIPKIVLKIMWFLKEHLINRFFWDFLMYCEHRKSLNEKK